METERAPRHLRVFLSSPSDVATERAVAFSLLKRLPYDPSMRGRVTVDIIAWDNPDAPIPMPATLSPQEAVNQGSPKPSECDIVLVILWTRIGTPLPREVTKADGSYYLSGTEWEYEDALQSDRRPIILVYRRTDAAPINPGDPDSEKKEEQFRGVNAFFERFDNPDGSLCRAYTRYQGLDQFKETLEYQVKDVVWHLLEDGSDVRATGPKARQKLQSHLAVGERLATQHRYAEAIAEYEKALQVDENDIGAHSRLIAARLAKLLAQAFGPESSISIALRHDYPKFQLAPQSEIDAALTAVYRLQALHPEYKY
jgi:hypothetical protein